MVSRLFLPMFAVRSKGCLGSTQKYKFCHAVTYGLSGVEDNDTEVRVKVRILDTDADNKNGRLVIRSLGYKHFHKKSQNETTTLCRRASYGS